MEFIGEEINLTKELINDGTIQKGNIRFSRVYGLGENQLETRDEFKLFEAAH
jgi:hypothetical protein